MSEELLLVARHVEAIRALLIENGVVTEKEYDAKVSWVTHKADQYLADIEERAVAEYNSQR